MQQLFPLGPPYHQLPCSQPELGNLTGGSKGGTVVCDERVKSDSTA